MTIAKIQFTDDLDEESLPNIILTRSRDGSTGTAIFLFKNPTIFDSKIQTEGSLSLTGMSLIDDEGILSTRNLQVNCINGKLKRIEAIYIMKNRDSWDRFMRFVMKYSKIKGLTFTQPN